MEKGLLLNADVGEGCGDDAALMPWLDQANIACAAHAGTVETMTRAVSLALEHGCSIGAHPGYDDPEHFGRRALKLPESELEAQLLTQLERLAREVERQGGHLDYIKPHGALYNQSVADATLASQLVEIGRRFDSALAWMTQPGGALARQVEAAGGRVIYEGFADRGYDAHGRLLPRSHPQGLLHEPEQAVRQARMLREKQGIHSLCVHGDHPRALAFVRALRQALAGGA